MPPIPLLSLALLGRDCDTFSSGELRMGQGHRDTWPQAAAASCIQGTVREQQRSAGPQLGCAKGAQPHSCCPAVKQ